MRKEIFLSHLSSEEGSFPSYCATECDGSDCTNIIHLLIQKKEIVRVIIQRWLSLQRNLKRKWLQNASPRVQGSTTGGVRLAHSSWLPCSYGYQLSSVGEEKGATNYN